MRSSWSIATRIRSATVPRRLRPTAPIGADAILVGDPGRALMLAQELLEEPKMSNHARGLWGYSGRTPAGEALTIQATGMGGPSAAVVIDDLAELGVRRAVRVGTCVAHDLGTANGALLVVDAAEGNDETALPDPDMTERLARELGGEGDTARVASLHEPPSATTPHHPGTIAADMQTATVLARGRTLGLAVAAILIVETEAGGEQIADPDLERAARRAGRAAANVLSP
jgi:purine-nucleoside phosphorylase